MTQRHSATKTPCSRRVLALVLAGVLLLAGCFVPRDPDKTLERVDARRELVVGVISAPPLTVVNGDQVSGSEAELMTAFARTRGASVRWVVGNGEQLVEKLDHHDVDLMVGGLTAQSPFKSKVGLTRGYVTDRDEYGKRVERVVAAPLGENALVTALERFFDERRGR